ncbi:hypothetical protein Pelo_12624 [Pelomyxa schiedti]|nr:hypothetical protein Pelo_12624 [Pelomyxa schiedti]
MATDVFSGVRNECAKSKKSCMIDYENQSNRKIVRRYIDLPGGMWVSEPAAAIPPSNSVVVAARARSIGGVKGSFSYAQDGDNMRTYVVTFDCAAPTPEGKVTVASAASAPGAKDPLKITLASTEFTDTQIIAKVVITNN